MNDNQPTDEQAKEFWERCGFKQLEWAKSGWHYEQTKKVMNWTHPLYEFSSMEFLPRLDLNNLFKYAVPKIRDQMGATAFIDFEHIIHKWAITIIWNNDDPALTLFWAIYEVIK